MSVIEKVDARPLDKGMGVAVARRTVFRREDFEDMGLVADRVARGNMGLVDDRRFNNAAEEEVLLRNAIAAGALITSGRHLQHGDADQARKNMELFTNCSTAIVSHPKFYLLLNGSGVGRAYDDELVVVDWANAPDLIVTLSAEHADFPHTREQLFQFAKEFNLLSYVQDADGAWVAPSIDDFDDLAQARAREYLDSQIHSPIIAGVAVDAPNSFWTRDPISGDWQKPKIQRLYDLFVETDDTTYFRVPDSREGWGKALELYEAMAFAGTATKAAGLSARRGKRLVLDFSDVRPLGAPIGGMQDRPASGPLSVMRAFINIRNIVVKNARSRDPLSLDWQPWEQAMHVDHYTSTEVQVGGARRAARMSTKNWRDPGIFRFIRIKAENGLWTSNNSVMVDDEFWRRVSRARETLRVTGTTEALSDLTLHAFQVFLDATKYSYVNGEPGFINGDKLDSVQTGKARLKPVYTNGEDFGSAKYKSTFGKDLLAEVARRAREATFPMTTNPCGEIELHVTGGYCVIADTAWLFASPLDVLDPAYLGTFSDEELEDWDDKVEESIRLGVRFLMRVNQMDALYGKEVERTNRIGIGFTGFHEWAWVRWGLGFRDLLDEAGAQPMWDLVKRFSDAAKDEAAIYAQILGVEVPHTVTTVKPAGTTSKLYGLTEGAHLPPRRQYLRWVQFKGQKGHDGKWLDGSDKLLADYEAKGYPVRELKTFPGMSIVGFPTVPLIAKLGMGDKLVTAPEATPEEQYQYLQLLEKYWIGERQGNQVSYTLKVYTDEHTLEGYRDIVLQYQPTVRCCSVMPCKPDREMGYEYLPEEEVSLDRFAEIVAGIRDDDLQQDIDVATLQCASGACPI